MALAFALMLVSCSDSEGVVEEQPRLDVRADATLTNTHAAAAEGHEHRIDYARFDRRLERLVDEAPAMVGLAVGVVEDGEITFLKGYGETVRGSGEQVTPETIFRWASVSKGVAGTMAAKLDAEGKIDLDDSIARYSRTLLLPEGAQVSARVRDVLSHRLGLWRNAYDDRLEGGKDPDEIRQQLGDLVLICPPGTCWSYQNIAFDAVTDVVAKATGMSYQDAVAQQLFAPLGMNSATMTREGLVNANNWARPHSVGRRELQVQEPYYRVPAAGGVNSNIKDMAIWMRAQMGEMPGVIPDAALEEAHSSLVSTPNENRRMRKYRERVGDPHYGLGWRSYDYEGHHVVGHRGGVDGYRSLILFDPELKTGVVALWNSNTGRPTGLQFEFLDLVYGLAFRDWLELDN